jgi:hypothetical protein
MGSDCWAHRHRELVPIEVHHVWPKGEGGPDHKFNKVRVCSNAHSATHDLLARMKAAHTDRLPWRTMRGYGWKVRRLARAGYQATTERRVVIP